jgi:hypothetical protein
VRIAETLRKAMAIAHPELDKSAHLSTGTDTKQ